MKIPASSPTPTNAADAVATLVRHFPENVRQAFSRFSSTRSPADADIVVLAVVQDHIPEKKRDSAPPIEDAYSLMEDLGFDSIAITEMVFFLEDLFHVRIGNDEIMRVRTVGDLRLFVRQKLATVTSTPRA